MPSLCSACGATLDSKFSDLESASSHFTLPLTSDKGDVSKESPWGKTWVEGSLGIVGRFQLREVIGDGGFGKVFKAYDPRLDRDIALKVLKENSPGERVMQRFFREARAAARLSHPNIVAVHDAGCDDGRCWIAYDLVQGRNLSRRSDSRKIDIRGSVKVAKELADALEYLHKIGVYHRDLKPANVMIDPNGRPHLIDFGLARFADLDSDLTMEGAVIGTPIYMSPEQAGGLSQFADERSDIYSLGVMLFELITGERPFDAPSQVRVVPSKPISATAAKSARATNPDVPAALDRIVERSLALNPRDRYASAREFAADLDRWLLTQQRMIGLSVPISTVITGIIAAMLLIAFGVQVLSNRHAPTRGQADTPSHSLVELNQITPLTAKTRIDNAEANVFLVKKPRGKWHLENATCGGRDANNFTERMSLEAFRKLQQEGSGLSLCEHCSQTLQKSTGNEQVEKKL